MNKIRKKHLVYFLSFVSFLGFLNIFWSWNSDMDSTRILSISSRNKFNKIVIGTVSCRKDNDTRSREETVVMIKSVIISAKLYEMENLEFHLFLEYLEDKNYFMDALKNFNFGTSIKTSVYFHSALKAVPQKYHDVMMYKPKYRCTYARLFFPSALPKVESIIYMDTDILITGSIVEMWSHFFEMNQEQLVGVVANNLPESNYPKYKKINCFKNIPHPKPIGVNAGLLLMNLKKMREYNWEEKLLRLFDDYSKVLKLEDQRLLNILLYYDTGLMYVLGCEFNIRCCPCDHGFLCKEARNSYHGVQAVHGAYNQFEEGGRFHYIYEMFKKFNMSSENVMEDLFMKIKSAKEPLDSKKTGIKCKKPINSFLFKNLLS